MPKIADTFRTIVFKALLIIIQFSIWFVAVGFFNKALGVIAGLSSALFLLIIINSKSGYRKDVVVKKRDAKISGTIQRAPEKAVMVKEWHLQ